jgi:hypothetical protein
VLLPYFEVDQQWACYLVDNKLLDVGDVENPHKIKEAMQRAHDRPNVETPLRAAPKRYAMVINARNGLTRTRP